MEKYNFNVYHDPKALSSDKQIVNIEISTLRSWNVPDSLPEFITKLQEINDSNKHLQVKIRQKIDYGYESGDESVEFLIYGTRLETDEEIVERLKNANYYKEKQVEQYRLEFERLKKLLGEK